MPPTFFASSGSAEARPIPRPVRVLVVDDEADTVVTLIAILRDEGYETKGISDPRMALAEVEAFHPDVVIVDIAMPHISGWEVARQVRKAKQRRPLLIAISGVYSTATDILMSRAAGFSHFLHKPCDPNFLLNILAALTPK